jgi:pantetheine-phosphate adenylyltransferase
MIFGMSQHAPRTAVYTGSFDPITLGHQNIIERASKLLDQLIVGIGINIDKQPLFTPEERVELVQRSISHLPNVSVQTYTGLTVKFVRSVGARVMLRGIRSLTDIEAEFTMTLANRKLDEGIETVFLMADDAYSHISSSLLKQITPLADDVELARFVPPVIIPDLRRKLTN